MHAWNSAGWLVALALLATAPAQAQPSPRVVDLHVDLPYQLHIHGRQLNDPRGEASPERMRRGQVVAIVLPLFVADAWKRPPAEIRASYESTYQTLLSAQRSSHLSPPTAEPRSGRVVTWLAFEGADGFADEPLALLPWIRRGACLVGLVHTRTNALAGSSSDPKTSARSMGLSTAGERLVRTALAHGALVDIAHASDAAVRDIATVAGTFHAPLICSHAGMRALKPIERNVSDEILKMIAASGGVVGVDLHSGHIGSRAGMQATLDDFIRHLEHAVRIAGFEHVAIGSDLEGRISAPSDADGAATWPDVADRLRKRGWQEHQISAVFHGNAERALKWATDHGCGAEGARSSKASSTASSSRENRL